MDYDILIAGGILLPLAQGRTELVDPGFLAVKDGLIRDLGPMAAMPPGCRAARTIDAAGCLVMPGLVNCHTHAAMTLFRGLADDLPLMAWLHEHIFPAEARLVDPDMVYWCTKLAAAEMLLGGTTTVADGYFCEDAAVAAFAEAGLRAVAAQGVIDFPAPGVPDPTENVGHAAAFVEQNKAAGSRIRPAIFCHSPYTCGPETLQKAKAAARRHGALFFIHAAETRAEVEECRERFGAAPIAHLHALGLLDPGTVCVHCVWLAPEEIDILQKSGAKVVTCPESNMKLASGIAPVQEMLGRGIPVGLGTDGCASNNNLDLFREMAACAKLHKVRRCEPTALPADALLRMATLEGARLLGLGQEIGSLEPGKKADCILVDLAQPHLTPFYSAHTLVHAASAADVTTVIIDGRLVVQDKKILTFDVKEAMAAVRRLSAHVRKPA